MRRLAQRVLPGALILLAGCSFIPAYERPAPPVAAHWPVLAQTAGVRAVAGLSWQQMLPDPRLQALINAALEHNRDLRIAVARVEEARALYGISRADRLPTVNLGAAQAAARLPGGLSATGNEQISRRYDINLGVAAFELDFWGRVKSLSASALASYLASAEARESFRLTLIADVANAYLAWQEMDERLSLARATVENRKDLRFLVQKRREVGLAGDLDFLAADGAHAAARAQLSELERGRAQAENALNLLVGKVPADLPPRRRLSEQDLPLDITVDVPAEVLLHRPDVRAAEQKLIAANANIGAARAAFLPRIGLSLAFGTASRTLSGLFDSGTGAWSFAPSLVQPLFDGGRTQGGVDLADARKLIAVAEYEKTIQQAFREVADLLVARDRLAEQLMAQEAAEKAQNERLRLVDARYRAGVSSYLEVLDAQRDAFATSQGTLQLRRALLVTAAQLYKALGGGQEIERGRNT
ncbi:MAG: efflux transporter outer membrane subunit [Rhodocyclaceae bacterium]|nr:efflux transporter outer membrane subunit [Rhodocyclaceae bacterium]MDP3031899.1 efflux transporter outer membrane subunit [Rhodocyclaceae bacterium]